jgi:hypothetical protein
MRIKRVCKIGYELCFECRFRSRWPIISKMAPQKSVADSDPGSGAFLSLDPGSGMGKKTKSGSGMNIPDHISESLETIFWVKNTLMRIRIRDPESF